MGFDLSFFTWVSATCDTFVLQQVYHMVVQHLFFGLYVTLDGPILAQRALLKSAEDRESPK
eukprot:4016617-Amphidinium_carterae.1